MITDNIVMIEIQQQHCRLFFQDSEFSGDLEDLNQPRVDFCVSSELEHSFLQVGCVRKELQFLTLQPNLKLFLRDACLCMDGIPALDLWDLFIEVLHSSNNVPGIPIARRDPEQIHQHQHSDEETWQPR